MNSVVTVILMTYNHENYIRKALDSILCQKTNFDFDILIHDDCSNDRTFEILSEYKKKNPKINIIRQESRRFLTDGFNAMIYKYVVPNLHSMFVAYCDGDDYWCDEKKLQKQYDFMINNPEYSMCFHSAFQLKQNNDTSSKWFIKDEGDIDISDIINDKPGVCVATSSVFVRTNVFKDFSNWRMSYPVEDVPLFITAALSGKIHRLADIMCVYRQFSSGSWSTQNKINQQRLLNHHLRIKESLLLFDKETNCQFHDLVVSENEWHDFMIANLNEDYRTIFSKKNKRFVSRMGRKERFLLRIRFRVPFLYSIYKKMHKCN